MSDAKINGFSSRLATKYEKKLSRGVSEAVAEGPVNSRLAAASGSANSTGQMGSWDAYKNWLTKVQAPEQKRSVPDPALFSWKGYRSWAEKVRRDWDAEDAG
ncbi:MAG: hypothetical protein V2J12_02495 [Gammaproteobacteria bacterium]|jgi:hypothetical protein|nr:hypothetical protein [Gammaproteobacteria bacterium]